jgi:hypothetical protein
MEQRHYMVMSKALPRFEGITATEDAHRDQARLYLFYGLVRCPKQVSDELFTPSRSGPACGTE